jgi:hypothetical protein
MSLDEALARYKNGNRLSAAQAGYMELEGAKKDGDCRKVEVKGGISKELGCCNEFQPEEKTTKRFSCGTCEYHKG